MNIEVYNHLQNEDLVALNLKLLGYANIRLGYLSWGHQHEGTTKGRLAQDFVQEALKLALTGKRNWNKSSEPDFLKFLKGIIKSCISNAVNSKENITSSASSTAELEASDSPNMEASQPSKDLIMEAEEMKTKIRSAIISADKDSVRTPLLLIFDALVDDEMKPKEIIDVLELDDAIVRNAIKRIRRITGKTLKT